MNNKLIPIVLAASVAGAVSAQNNGIRFFGGYGWSGSINRLSAGSTHLMGPELGVDVPVSHQAQVEEDFRADVLLGGQLVHGSDLDGYIYRFLMMTRTTVPGSNLTTFGGVGWGFAQARAGEFHSFSGFVSQIGLGMPLGAKIAGISPSLDVTVDFGSRGGLGGYFVGLSLRI